MPPALVRRLLQEFTDPSDRVLDPFAGFGTTLAVAERLDRTGWGVEYEADRVAYAAEHLDNPERLHHGTATDIPDGIPTVDCVLTSPPYMHESDDRNPLRNYDGTSDYETYHDDLSGVFDEVADRLREGGTLLVEAANLKHDDRVTTFAWDLVAELRTLRSLRFAGEIAVSWEGTSDSPEEAGVYGFGYDHSYVLLFQRD
jgi:SAM-dependent methyltransferase